MTIKTNGCPECGSPEAHEKDSLGPGFRICSVCYQEWWTDVDYRDRKILPLEEFRTESRVPFLLEEGTRFLYQDKPWRIDRSSVLVPQKLIVAHGRRILVDGSIGKTTISISIVYGDPTLVTPEISRPRSSGRGKSKRK